METLGTERDPSTSVCSAQLHPSYSELGLEARDLRGQKWETWERMGKESQPLVLQRGKLRPGEAYAIPGPSIWICAVGMGQK